MPFGIGPGELIIVLVLALIILGPKRLPEVGRSVGRGMREFKEGISGNSKDDDDLDLDRDVVAGSQAHQERALAVGGAGPRREDGVRRARAGHARRHRAAARAAAPAHR